MKKLLFAAAVAASMGGTGYATVFDFGFLGGQMDGAEAGTLSPATGSTFDPGISYDDVSNLLTFNFEYFNLQSSWTGTELREGAPATVGTLITALATDQITAVDGYVSPSSPGSPQGPVSLTGAQETALMGSQLFVLIKSNLNPNGEIRGQLTPVPEPQTYALAGGLALLGFAGYRRFKKTRPATV